MNSDQNISTIIITQVREINDKKDKEELEDVRNINNYNKCKYIASYVYKVLCESISNLNIVETDYHNTYRTFINNTLEKELSMLLQNASKYKLIKYFKSCSSENTCSACHHNMYCGNNKHTFEEKIDMLVYINEYLNDLIKTSKTLYILYNVQIKFLRKRTLSFFRKIFNQSKSSVYGQDPTKNYESTIGIEFGVDVTLLPKIDGSFLRIIK